MIRSYVEDHGISWRQVAEGDDGPILDLYRVDRHPSYVLIGPGGMIHSRTNRDLESQVSEIIGATSPSE